MKLADNSQLFRSFAISQYATRVDTELSVKVAPVKVCIDYAINDGAQEAFERYYSRLKVEVWIRSIYFYNGLTDVSTERMVGVCQSSSTNFA